MEYVADTPAGYGLKKVLCSDNGSDKRKAIIVVHGISSKCEHMASLVDAMTGDSRLSDYDFYAFDYNGNDAIHDNGKLLLNTITDQPLNQYQTLGFICHSMGGLIARSAFLQSGASLPVRFLFMLGTPNFGAVKPSQQAMVGAILVKIAGHVSATPLKKKGRKNLTEVEKIFQPYVDTNSKDIPGEFITIPGLCYNQDGNMMRNSGGMGWAFKAINGMSRLLPSIISLRKPHDGIVEEISNSFIGPNGRRTEKDSSIRRVNSPATYTHLILSECRYLHHCQLYEDADVNQSIIEIIDSGTVNVWLSGLPEARKRRIDFIQHPYP